MNRQIEAMRRRWFEQLPAQVVAEMQDEVVAAGEELADMMRRLVPVDKGDLRDSITVTPPGQTTPSHSQPGGTRQAKANEVLITAGDSKARYAHLVEYGTRHAHAQPYFWPSYRASVKRIKQRLSRAYGRAFRKVSNHVG